MILVIYTQFQKETYTESSVRKTNLRNNESNTNSTELPKVSKKIHSEKYDRFILTKNTTEEYILSMIKEFGEISGNEEYQIHSFGIAKFGDWILIKIGPSVSFYEYHNLIVWLLGYEEIPEIPELSIGFAKSKTDIGQNYICHVDAENEHGDTMIGAFHNGKSFSIYLPEAYEEHGNLTISDNVKSSMEENIDSISKEGFNISKLMSVTYIEHKIKMNQ